MLPRALTIVKIAMRVFFALLLAASAMGKLLDMPGFYRIVESYDTFSTAFIPPLAWLLALTELALVAWVVSGGRLVLAAAAIIALHVVYFMWVGVALIRGLHIANCGCFGVYWPRPLTAYTLLEDAILLGLACLLWRAALKRDAETRR
jgi:Methylamine utilisation protein MauE